MGRKKKIYLLNISKEDCIKFKKRSNEQHFFIGPWCKNNIDLLKENFNDTLNLYDRKKIKKYKKDISFLQENYEIILEIIIKNLNIIHKKKLNKKFWEILLSRWLFVWINHIYFRWDYIKKINKKFSLNNIVSNQINPNYAIPSNTLQAHNLCRVDEKWNELIFNQILSYQTKNKIKYIYLKNIDYKKNDFQILDFPKFSFFRKKSNLFLYKSELNFKTRLSIRNYYNSYSISFFSQKKIYRKIKSDFRKKFDNLLPKSNKNNFKEFLISILKYNLPKIFLENFKDLENLYLRSQWPQNVNYIITSYGQYYDELFKFYVANLTKNKKVKFCILQHGYGNLFPKSDFYNVYLDRKVSDIYLSWGNLKREKNKPLFYPRVTNSKIENFKYKKNRNILILSYSFSNTLITPPDGSLNGNSINQKNLFSLISFLNQIKFDLKKFIHIKNQKINVSKNFTDSLKKKFSFLKFKSEKKSFLEVVNNFNFFIHIFFGTPFFECMALNKPSIIIYKDITHPPFDKKFYDYLKKFKKSKILFNNEKLAANFVKKNYYNLEKWWNGNELQKIRKDFCNDYCLYTDKYIDIFKKVFVRN